MCLVRWCAKCAGVSSGASSMLVRSVISRSMFDISIQKIAFYDEFLIFWPSDLSFYDVFFDLGLQTCYFTMCF